MVLAAVESYCLGDSHRTNRTKLETLGYVWGYARIKSDQKIYHLTRISLSLSAKRSQNSVDPHPKAAILKNEIVTRWSPHLSLIGDFHTHPYEDVNEVNEINGFEFSDQDFISFQNDELIWEESDNSPLMLAMTICRMKRVHIKFSGEQVRNNVCKFYLGEFCFWLNASAGFIRDGVRFYTGNKRSSLFLDLNSRFFNLESDRIDQR